VPGFGQKIQAVTNPDAVGPGQGHQVGNGANGHQGEVIHKIRAVLGADDLGIQIVAFQGGQEEEGHTHPGGRGIAPDGVAVGIDGGQGLRRGGRQFVVVGYDDVHPIFCGGVNGLVVGNAVIHGHDQAYALTRQGAGGLRLQAVAVA
jgi:hypothetical protein